LDGGIPLPILILLGLFWREALNNGASARTSFVAARCVDRAPTAFPLPFGSREM
jgi:hypothetical protein